MSLEALKTFHSSFLKYMQYKDEIGKKLESFKYRIGMPSLKYGEDTCIVFQDEVRSHSTGIDLSKRYVFIKIYTLLQDFRCTININSHARLFESVLHYNNYYINLQDSVVQVHNRSVLDDESERTLLFKIPVLEFNNLTSDDMFQYSTIIDNFDELHKMFVYIQEYDFCLLASTETLIGVGSVLKAECERLERIL